MQARSSPGIRRSYRLDGNVAMAIAAERSRSMLGYVCEQHSERSESSIDNVDTDVEIIYRERSAV